MAWWSHGSRNPPKTRSDRTRDRVAMGALLEYLESAIKNIRSNKLRTGLTMLGIIIGIASVIAVLTIGNGLTAYVHKEMGGFSSNLAELAINTGLTSELFTPEDIALLDESIPNLMGASYDLEGFGVLTGRRAAVDASYTAGSPVLEHFSANKVEYGRYFTQDDVDNHAPVCIITERDAVKLTGAKNAVGQTLEFTVNGLSKEMTVIGVRENYSEAILTMLDQLEDYTAFVELPYTSIAELERLDIDAGQQYLLLFGETGSDVDEITRAATRFWKNRHGVREEDAVFSISMADITDQINTIFGAITTFMSFVAAISLLVGGIGVMNIMLVSVTERTREIGIRKSIGARTGSIMVQFLAEASIISLMGGIVGVALGIGIAAVACHIFDFALTVEPSVIVMATVFSTAVGLFFGLYPARKAAKMRPIDALRY